MIIAGRLSPDMTRENESSRWIKGTIMPYGPCALLLEEIGPQGQSRLPFTITTDRPLPRKPVVVIGSLSEYKFPDNGKVWYTLNITEYYEKGDLVLDEFGTFNELATKIAKKDSYVMSALGDRKTMVKENLQAIFGTGNSFADRMIDRFGVSAYDKLKDNPWQMIHIIPYFTIKQADHAAEYFGIPLTHENRFREHFRSRLNLFFEDRRDTYMNDSDFYTLYLLDFADEMTKEEFMARTMYCDDPLVIRSNL